MGTREKGKVLPGNWKSLLNFIWCPSSAWVQSLEALLPRGICSTGSPPWNPEAGASPGSVPRQSMGTREKGKVLPGNWKILVKLSWCPSSASYRGDTVRVTRENNRETACQEAATPFTKSNTHTS
jgi:hypothetical protein